MCRSYVYVRNKQGKDCVFIHGFYLIYALLSQIKLCRYYALFGGHFWPKFHGRGQQNILKDRATKISSKLGHQVSQLALVQHLIIRRCQLHCFQSWPLGRIARLPWISLLALSVSIGLVSSSARVTSPLTQHYYVHYIQPILYFIAIKYNMGWIMQENPQSWNQFGDDIKWLSNHNMLTCAGSQKLSN